MKKTAKNLLISSVALCVSTALVVGATYALFTGEATVNNHLQAGTLQVGLTRTSFIEHSLTAEGLLADKTEDKTVINLKENPKVLFSVENAVPQCWYQATVNVKNEGSVAFDYGMRILWDSAKATEDEKLFAEQIKINVSCAAFSTNAEFYLIDCAKNNVNLGYLLKGASSDVVVRATFVDDEEKTGIDNDSVQNKSINFDLQVYATQKVQ